MATSPTPRSQASIGRGRELWLQDCAVCHGAAGHGDGPVAAQLRRQPKDLSRIASPPVFPDGILAYRIANGGEVMPAWKSVLSAGQIWDLVDFIRSLRQPQPG